MPMCSRGMSRTLCGPSWNWCERPLLWGESRQAVNKGMEPVRRSARLMLVVSSWISDQDLRVCNPENLYADSRVRGKFAAAPRGLFHFCGCAHVRVDVFGEQCLHRSLIISIYWKARRGEWGEAESSGAHPEGQFPQVVSVERISDPQFRPVTAL